MESSVNSGAVKSSDSGMSSTTIIVIIVVFFVFILLILMLVFFLRPRNTDEGNVNRRVGPIGPPGPPGPTGPIGPPGDGGGGIDEGFALQQTREFGLTIPNNATGTVTLPFSFSRFRPENYTVSLLIPTGGYGINRRNIIPSNGPNSSAPIRYDTSENSGSLIVTFYGGSYGNTQAVLSVTAFNRGGFRDRDDFDRDRRWEQPYY